MISIWPLAKVSRSRMWSAHVLLKYWALQAAGWIVVFVAAWFAAELFDWPRTVVWIIVGVWATKDALLYPLVWRAYDQRDARSSAYPEEGAEGVTLHRLDPAGSVRVAGERWRATTGEAEAPIDAGERVRVTGRDGMTLIVARAEPRPRPRKTVNSIGGDG